MNAGGLVLSSVIPTRLTRMADEQQPRANVPVALIQQLVAGPRALPNQVQACQEQVQAPDQVQQPGDNQAHMAAGQPQPQPVAAPQAQPEVRYNNILPSILLRLVLAPVFSLGNLVRLNYLTCVACLAGRCLFSLSARTC